MNIVIVPPVKQKAERESYNLLYKHAEEWVKNGNRVFVIKNKSEMNFDSEGLETVERPKFAFVNSLLTMWFNLINHPEIDVVIEDFTFFPIRTKKSIKVFMYRDHGETLLFTKMKKILFDKFYKDKYFMVTDNMLVEKLVNMGVLRSKIVVIKKGFAISKKIGMKKRKNNKITIIHINSSTNIKYSKDALSVMEGIERRNPNCIYYFVLRKDLFEAFKKLTKTEEFTKKMKVRILDKVTDLGLEFERSDLLIDTESSNESVDRDLAAMFTGVEVIAFRSSVITQMKGFEKSTTIIKDKNIFDMADNAINLVSKLEKNGKTSKKLQSYTSKFTWQNVTSESFRFLESLK